MYAEGQRRYVESLSAYARQFLSMMDKPDVDSIEGLSPAIAIEQKAGSHNPRSTVGTVTEIYDYLRLLYARAGLPRCPNHGIDLAAQSVGQMVDQVLQAGPDQSALLLAPLVTDRKGEHAQLIGELAGQGYVRVRIDGTVLRTRPGAQPCSRGASTPSRRWSTGSASGPRVAQRLAESFETALKLSNGTARVVFGDESRIAPLTFSSRHACPECGFSVPNLEPRLFSFNNPAGACPSCDGLGVQDFFDPQRVISQPQLSLAAGAVRGWDRHNKHYFQLLQGLARHYEFDIDTPWSELPGAGAHALAVRERGRRDRVSLQRRARQRAAAPPRLRGHHAQPRTALARERVERRCAKSWDATAAPGPAPTATARA